MNGQSAAQPTDARQAIVALHNVAGSARGIPSTVAGLELGDALLAVANSESDEITPAAKLNILVKLIKAGKPELEDHKRAFRALADSIAPELGGKRLLNDLHSVVDGSKDLRETDSGKALPHHIAAFLMEDVCTTSKVAVGGIDAAWIFSEFETTASFDDVADWVDPHNWPDRTPTMFKGMKPVNPITYITRTQDLTEWHGLFLETVQLVEVLNTELWCDFYRKDDVFAGMAYSLERSVDSQIDVDRGFLLVNDLGKYRRVKALKIVSFTTNLWDNVALWVCPLWTDFVQAAVEGGVESESKEDTSTPGTVASPVEQWASFASESAREYVDLSTGWARRMASGSYRSDDIVKDSARFWLQAYRDMLNAGARSYSILEQLAGVRRAPGQAIPVGVSASDAKNTHWGLRSAAVNYTPGLDLSGPVTTTDLTRIGIPQEVIPAKSVQASREKAHRSSAVQIEADVSTAKEGLYIGDAMDRKGNKAPVQLYVSRAVKKGSA